jgi:hypothetical protein
MLFVGRKSEKKKIIESLHNGKNIILGGKFGIGRTSLIRNIAKMLADERKFVFVDFSQTPGRMSEKLMKESGLSMRLKNKGNKMSYKSMRYRIANAKSSKGENPVIVFDNIAKITFQKIMFLRHLISEQHYQFIAIVEKFLPQKDLFALKAQFMPFVILTLGHLKTNDVENLLHNYAEKNHLNWMNSFTHKLALLSDGYPLGLVEMLKKELLNLSNGNHQFRQLPGTVDCQLKSEGNDMSKDPDWER